MKPSPSPAAEAKPSRWISLWVVALLSLLGQLWICQFFAMDPKSHAFGQMVPFSEDVNPSKLWMLAYSFPPTATFQVLNWLGVAYLPQPLNPLSVATALMSSWFFFTSYVPILSTLALLAMAAFLRELEISRPAALFAAVIYAWQGDVLSFIFPGHYGYLTSWPFYAIGAWAALRSARTGRWPYAVIGGVCCGTMVGLLTNADRGGIASVLIGVLFLVPLLRKGSTQRPLLHFVLCVTVAAIVALAPLATLFKGNISSVTLGGATKRDDIYKMVVEYSLGPAETLTYLAPGFFGWHMSSQGDGLYWGWIGEWPDWESKHAGQANMNLAISTCGTIATLLAIMGAILVLPGRLLGADRLSDRQRFYARVLLVLGLVSLVLSWGQHIGFLYRPLVDYVPLMDKWRDPLKWLEWFNFALMPLGAIGLDQLGATLALEPATKSLRRRFLIFVSVVFTLLLAGLFVAYAMGDVAREHFLHNGLDPATVATMVDMMHVALIRAILLTIALGVIPVVLWRAEALRRWNVVNPWLQTLWEKALRPEQLSLTLALILAGLSVVQLGWVAQRFIQPWPLHVLVMSNPVLDVLQHEGDRVRCSVDVNDPTLNFLLQNQFAAMDISCLDISAASRYPLDLNAFFHTFDNDHAPLWFLAGVKNLVVPAPDVNDLRAQSDVMANIDHVDGYTLVPTGSPSVPSHAFITLKYCLAKATLAPEYEVLPKEAVQKRLMDHTWNPRKTVLLSLAGADEHDPALLGDLTSASAVKFPEAPSAQADMDQVDLQKYTPTEIDLDVESTRNAFVLINDYYDHDWQVEVNGKSAPLLRADYVMRAIAVPAGSSTITMHYVATYDLPHLGRFPATAVCLFSDGAMLAAWVVAGLALWRKR